MRMMVTFSKGNEIRFIGHLDLMRTLQRALRRSGLPLRFSNGFNPHILLGFALPLSVGVVGLNEWMDVPLSEPIAPKDFARQLNAVLPASIRIGACFPAEDHFPPLMSLAAGAQYRIFFYSDLSPEDRIKQYRDFCSQEQIITLRKTKSGEKDCDIKRFVQKTHLEAQGELSIIYLTIRADTDGMLKPALWFNAFCDFCGREDRTHVAYRDHILALDATGALVPMKELLQ